MVAVERRECLLLAGGAGFTEEAAFVVGLGGWVRFRQVTIRDKG